jgi:uncharacterized MAPEG superfamily protein
MTIPFWCLVVVIFLPILIAFSGGYFRSKAFGTADNKHPRLQAAKLEGPGARAYAAQANAWEAATTFSAAVLISHLVGVSAASAAPWTIAYVGFRILHVVFYIANLDLLRSLVFIGGQACVIALIVKAAMI